MDNFSNAHLDTKNLAQAWLNLFYNESCESSIGRAISKGAMPRAATLIISGEQLEEIEGEQMWRVQDVVLALDAKHGASTRLLNTLGSTTYLTQEGVLISKPVAAHAKTSDKQYVQAEQRIAKQLYAFKEAVEQYKARPAPDSPFKKLA